MTLYLHIYGPVWSLASMCPHSLRLETYIRMLKIPFMVDIPSDNTAGPSGCLPYITDGPDYGGVSRIFNHLATKYGSKLDEHLSESDRAMSHCICRMIEGPLVAAINASRYGSSGNWKLVRQALRISLPKAFSKTIVNKPVTFAHKRRMLGAVESLGYTADNALDEGCRDIITLSKLLGTKQFMFGDTPTSVDAAVYGALANIIVPPIESPLKRKALELSNLVHYVERMRQRFFSQLKDGKQEVKRVELTADEARKVGFESSRPQQSTSTTKPIMSPSSKTRAPPPPPLPQKKEAAPKGKRCIALYDYTATDDTELTIHTGQILYCSHVDNAPGWLFASYADARAGEGALVPESYVKEQAPVKSRFDGLAAKS